MSFFNSLLELADNVTDDTEGPLVEFYNGHLLLDRQSFDYNANKFVIPERFLSSSDFFNPYSNYYETSNNIIGSGINPIFIFLGLFILVFYLLNFTSLKYQLNSPFKKLTQVLPALGERILAALAYVKPLTEMCYMYGAYLIGCSPAVRETIAPSVGAFVQWYHLTIPDSFSLIYFVVVQTCTQRYRFPKSRFIRFHWLRSIILTMAFSILTEWYDTQSKLTKIGLSDLDLEFWGIVCWLITILITLPAIIEALLGLYPRSWVVREAIEVLLGRDGPDFRWWDERSDET